MTNKEAVIWLTNVMADIGEAKHSDLWHYEQALSEIKEMLESQLERKKGKWIDKSDGIDGAWNYCSVCGEQVIDLYDFCPNCGADMREDT